MESQGYEVLQCLQEALENLGSHLSTFIKCFHTDDGGLIGFLFSNTELEQLWFEVSSIENEVILIIIKQNKQKIKAHNF